MIPFFVAYALCRTRERKFVLGAALGAAAAVAAGVLVRQTIIKGSTQSGGRSLDEISSYSARVGDFLSRNVDHARSEQFVFLGWVTPLLAIAGLVLLIRARRYALAAVLGLGALVPIVLALGTRTPIYTALWHALPPFRFPRVPERLLPIACLCIAALVAFVVARSTRLTVVTLAIAVLFVDLHARVYGKSEPGDPDGARPAASGRLLELPVFDPGVHYGSVYLWYDTSAQRERPGGYSTTAPKAAKPVAEQLERLNCGDWSGNVARLVDRLGIRSIALHRGLYLRNPAVPSTAWFAWHALLEQGWTVQRTAGPVSVFERRSIGLQPALLEPSRARPVFCQGWYGDTGSGRYMSETHAPFWIYGSGKVRLRFAPSPLRPRVTVHGGDKVGWHLVTVDVPHLRRVEGQPRAVGLRLVRVESSLVLAEQGPVEEPDHAPLVFLGLRVDAANVSGARDLPDQLRRPGSRVVLRVQISLALLAVLAVDEEDRRRRDPRAEILEAWRRHAVREQAGLRQSARHRKAVRATSCWC